MALIDNLISYWKLDEASGDAADAHGSNTLTDTNTVGTGAGKIGTSRDFEFSSFEYFSKADNADLSTGDIDFSFGFWMNPESFSNYNNPLSKDGSGEREYLFYIDHTDSNKILFGVSSNGSSVVTVKWATGLSAGTWYYVAGGHNATTNEIWISVNGGTPVTQAHSAGVRNGTGSFYLGFSPIGSNYFDGLLDEVGFWKRDIRSDLSALYNSGNGLAYPFPSGNSSNYYAQQQ